VLAARKDQGHTDYYQLNLPATSERIRMACNDEIAKLCITGAGGSALAGAETAAPGVVHFQPRGSC
jgi:hypothetical protein